MGLKSQKKKLFNRRDNEMNFYVKPFQGAIWAERSKQFEGKGHITDGCRHEKGARASQRTELFQIPRRKKTRSAGGRKSHQEERQHVQLGWALSRNEKLLTKGRLVNRGDSQQQVGEKKERGDRKGL